MLLNLRVHSGTLLTCSMSYFIGTEFIALIKMPNFLFGKFTIAQSEAAEHFILFMSLKGFCKISLFFHACKSTFGCGCTTWLHGHIPWEEGWGTGVGRSSSIYPNSKNLIENPEKLSESEFGKFTSMEKYTQLLFDIMNLAFSLLNKVGFCPPCQPNSLALLNYCLLNDLNSPFYAIFSLYLSLVLAHCLL
jgi:hypothetical protein